MIADLLGTLGALCLTGAIRLLGALVPAGLDGSNGSNGDATFWMPPQRSTVAADVDWVYYVIYWISVAFFVAIVGVMIWFMLRYRRRAEGEAVERSPTHNTPIEVTWTVLPLILVIWIFWVGFKGYMDLRTPPGNSYQVLVTGQTWSWMFTYPNGYVDEKLHVPVDTPVELTMTSEDMLHSFFVPDFRVKMDVVPGKYTKLWFTATEPGEYQVYCTEYCGTGHSDMTTKVVVHDPGGFVPWLEKASDFLDTMAPVDAGKRLYEIRGCTQCHSIDGSSGTGPTFRGVWGKQEIMDGGERITVDENYVRESILNPQAKILSGYEGVMPTYQGRLKDREITAIIEFIKSLSGEGI